MLSEREQARLDELEQQLAPQQAATSNLNEKEQARLNELEQQFSQQSTQQGLSSQEAKRLSELEGQEKYKAYQSVKSAIGGFIAKGVEQTQRVGQIYEEERLAGRSAVQKAYNYPSWGNVGRGLLGAAQYTMAPVTALARGAVGEPVKENLERVPGLKDTSLPLGLGSVPEFAGRMAEEAFYWTPVGAATKARMIMRQPSGAVAEHVMPIAGGGLIAREGGTMAKTLEKKAPLNIPPVKEELSPALKTILKGDGIALEPKLQSNIVRDVTNASADYLRGNVDESRRIFRRISDGLGTGEINPEFLPEIMQKYGIKPQEFAQMYRDTVSYAGRALGYHGRLAQQLKQVFKNEPEALAVFEDLAKAESKVLSLTDTIADGWSRLENTRRGLLVTQLATAMRNAVSQAGRLTISSLDETFQGVLRGTVGGQGNTLQEMQNGLNNLFAVYHRMTPSGRARLSEILEASSGAVEKARLLSQPVHEVVGGKVVNALNWVNRTQEVFFRKLAFEAKMRELLSRSKLDYNTIDPSLIPESLFKEAVDYSLEMTFAASPKSKAGQEFLRAYNRMGLTLVNPFPRFALKNALPFVFEHSPLGYLKAVSPEVLKELASGNPERFAKAASRATLGSLMLNSAWNLRQSEYAGEKWYEIKTGVDPKTGESKVIDTRAYAPFNTYLFIAEAFLHPERLEPADYAGAAIGLNRVAGTGLVLTDLLRAKSETAKQIMGKFVGSYLASFSVPFRTAKDFFSGLDREESVYRDTRSDPIAGPFLANIPKISQMFPESHSPYTSKRQMATPDTDIMGIPAPVVKQLTGFMQTIKPVMKAEVDRLGLPYTSIYPKTGIPEADRKILQYMGPLVEQFGPSIINSPEYRAMGPLEQEYRLKELFASARGTAKKMLAIKDFPLWAEVWKKERASRIELMQEMGRR